MRETFSEFDKNLINLEILILYWIILLIQRMTTVNNAKARERISKVTDDLHFLDYFKIGTLIKG